MIKTKTIAKGKCFGSPARQPDSLVINIPNLLSSYQDGGERESKEAQLASYLHEIPHKRLNHSNILLIILTKTFQLLHLVFNSTFAKSLT